MALKALCIIFQIEMRVISSAIILSIFSIAFFLYGVRQIKKIQRIGGVI